jgi:hypothetical protein
MASTAAAAIGGQSLDQKGDWRSSERRRLKWKRRSTERRQPFAARLRGILSVRAECIWGRFISSRGRDHSISEATYGRPVVAPGHQRPARRFALGQIRPRQSQAAVTGLAPISAAPACDRGGRVGTCRAPVLVCRRHPSFAEAGGAFGQHFDAVKSLARGDVKRLFVRSRKGDVRRLAAADVLRRPVEITPRNRTLTGHRMMSVAGQQPSFESVTVGKAIRPTPERKLGNSHCTGANDDPCY